jgi:L-seryl-tRNA(Ser) seleniumtransferase
MDPTRQVKPDPRRGLPAIDRLLRELASSHPEMPEWAVAAASRSVLSGTREALSRGDDADVSLEALCVRVAAQAARLVRPQPVRVVNATGIVLHTNLGRAPMAPGAAEAVARVASSYSALELDLESGRRGGRGSGVAEKLGLLGGAEASLVVNNNAAALMLVLDTLARGREVIVSRGELVEIGGSFRVPDIMERAGVRLVEVGTTNRTHLADYEAAITPETALLLKVHRSNFAVSGFVAEVGLGELVALGRSQGLPVVEDLGSGTLVDLTDRGLPAEVYAPGRLALGADVICFSGDKLLGGPQAGIALGRAEPIESMRRNPLFRALRIDKLGLAALDWTLAALLDGRGEEQIPVLQQLLAPVPDLEARARRLARQLEALSPAGRPDNGSASGWVVEVAPERAPVGGGSLPGFELDTWVVSVAATHGAEALAVGLRGASSPVLARVRDGRIVFDVRTLLDGDENRLTTSLGEVLQALAV